MLNRSIVELCRGELVEQKLEAAPRHLADRIGLPAAIQIGGCGFCARRRLDDDVVEMPVLAVVREALVRGPRLDDQVEALLEALVGLPIGMQKLANSLWR